MKEVIQHQNDWYLSRFTAFEESLNGESSSPVHAIRRAAIQRFGELGFPTTRHEEWRFTNIAPIARESFQPVLRHVPGRVTQTDIERFLFKKYACHLLVFVNGQYAPELSSVGKLPAGVRVGSLSVMLKSDGDLVGPYLARYAEFRGNAFTALNTAFMNDGAFIHVPEGVAVNNPIYLLFVAVGETSAFVAQPRNLVVLGRNSRVSIVERYSAIASDAYFTNTVTEMLVGEGAVVEHDKLQDESIEAFHVSSYHIHQDAGSNFTSNSISLGGAIVRNNITAVLDAEGIECTLNGLSLGTGKQLVDNHTAIDHAKPRCASHELYKSILDGNARGVFNGKIFVRKDAQKTDAKQTNKTLLLSDQATIDTKPQLEIFADDVKCTHGATVGQLDEEQLFYLRSRGLAQSEARDILTFAFVSDVIERIHVDPLRKQLDIMLHAQLQRGRVVQ